MLDDFVLSWQRRLWDAERFGLTPAKLVKRLTTEPGPRVLCISLPKAGTHLLERAICRLPGLRRKVLPTVHDANIDRWGELGDVLASLSVGQVAVAHLGFSPERLDSLIHTETRGFFVIRDPRDIVVSQASYIMSKPKHPQHQVFTAEKDQRSRILRAIRGNAATGLDSVGARLRLYQGWLCPQLHLVRFEELIGGRGQGTDQTQTEVLRGVCRHLGVALGPEAFERLATGVFSQASPTFHRGAVGGWRDVFDDETAEAFEDEAGEELRRYGYS